MLVVTVMCGGVLGVGGVTVNLVKLATGKGTLVATK